MFDHSTLRLNRLSCFVFGLFIFFCGEAVYAQSTAFTYQGKLTDTGGAPLTGNYDLQFKLFDMVSGGTQVGATLTFDGAGGNPPFVVVTSGIFTVQLDFGACPTCFNGAARFLEIAVKPHGGGSFTTLAPRQPVTSIPYALKTQYLTFNGPYNDGDDTIFTASNTFAGDGAGGNTNPSPILNNFNGKFNSFFGAGAAKMNTTGSFNSFFGAQTGINNTTGLSNSFFGQSAGFSNTNGGGNSFFGISAGAGNTTGNFNAFFGQLAGAGNTTGIWNTMIGHQANVSANNLNNATALGSHAVVGCSNCLVLGSINGVNFASADTNVGIGTTAPQSRLHIAVNGGNLLLGHAGCGPGHTGIGFGASLSGCNNYALLGNSTDTLINRPTGGGIFFQENNVDQMIISAGGAVTINTLGAAGGTQLCRNASNQIANCSSSIRYKTNIATLHTGLTLINRLRPVTFDWKQGGEADLGLVAEEVAKVEPLLVTRNDKGEIEGVKYDRVSVVLVNAVKDQQAQITEQQRQIESQRRVIEQQQQQLNRQAEQVEVLKKLICSSHRKAGVCK